MSRDLYDVIKKIMSVGRGRAAGLMLDFCVRANGSHPNGKLILHCY
jgi:hypothetical protein